MILHSFSKKMHYLVQFPPYTTVDAGLCSESRPQAVRMHTREFEQDDFVIIEPSLVQKQIVKPEKFRVSQDPKSG